jgi:SAM-dependent methyltransferase
MPSPRERFRYSRTTIQSRNRHRSKRSRSGETDGSFQFLPDQRLGLDFIRRRNEFRTTSAHSPRGAFQPRKRDLLDHFEGNSDELDRWREFNAAYHEDDRKFMRFLIPPGKRVLELGCGRGDLLAALEPSYGVGVDFGAQAIAKAGARYPDLHFVYGDIEDPATMSFIEGPFDYIVMADTIGMFDDIDGTLRPAIVLSIDPHRHRLLLAFVGTGPQTRRGVASAQQAAQHQLHRHGRLPEPDRPRGFRADHAGTTAIAAAALAWARPIHQPVHRAAAGDQAAVPAHLYRRTSGPAFSGPPIFREHPDPLPQ